MRNLSYRAETSLGEQLEAVTALACLLFTLGSAARAETLSLSGSAQGLVRHSFYGHLTTADVQNLAFTVPADHLSRFNEVQITVHAPDGYAWRVDDDSTFQGAQLHLWFGYGGASSPYVESYSIHSDFDLLEGSVDLLSPYSSHASIPTAGDGFYCDQWLRVTGDLVFTSFTTTVFFDNSSVFDSAPGPVGSRVGFLEFSFSSPPTDPGQRLTLVPVPEPSVLRFSMLALGILAIFRFGRPGHGTIK